MLSKTLSKADCSICPLSTRGIGFVPFQPAGPSFTKIALIGESPGLRETENGTPFFGPAGGELNRLLYRLKHSRSDFIIGNCTSCRPPHDKLERMPWEYAIDCCRPNLDATLAAPDLRVVVALGGVPTRQLLGVSGNLKDFHGTVTSTTLPDGRQIFVVPTFHPSHLVRGAHNLTATVLFDLSRALEVAEAGWEPDLPTLRLDPSPAEFSAWAEEYLLAVAQDPLYIWLSVDIETPDTERKLDEGELKSTDKSMAINRINFSFRTDEGITVPFVGPYVPIIQKILASQGPKWFWNKHYDLRRLWSVFGVDSICGPLLDGMDAWHALHSDVPKGLGFVAPFYSRMGAWKHLSHSRPAFYAACDAVQNQRSCYGVAADLYSQGMWNVFWRHMHEVDRIATGPSCRVGLKVEADKLEEMRVDLHTKAVGFFFSMQDLVAEELKPLHPKDGWTHRPKAADGDGTGTVLWPEEGKPNRRPRQVLELLREVETSRCTACGATGVSVKHRCKDSSTGKPVKGENPAQVVKVRAAMPRYFIREDFNPGSPQQVLAYIKSCKHLPGREHGKETTNRETIERLAEGAPKSQKDEKARELYRLLLDFRDVKKILGTYVEGMLRRLKESEDGRVHPVVTNNPSTMRTAYNSPNLQNVVADRRGKASLASGFRKCIRAEEEEEGMPLIPSLEE